MPDYHLWEEFNEGSYGCIRISPDGTRAVKEILPGPDGEPGQFGSYEVELATTRGRLGHSPRVYRALDTHIEMDFVSGGPMWASYKPAEDESVMNAAQTLKLAASLHDLHLMGYAHGDMHVRQVLVDGDDVKLVDYGSAAPISERPVKAMHDLNKIACLANWIGRWPRSVVAAPADAGGGVIPARTWSFVRADPDIAGDPDWCGNISGRTVTTALP